MGVDYYSNYGVGFKVQVFSDTDYIDELGNLLKDEPYRFFEVGDGTYTGNQDDVFVVLEEFGAIETLQTRCESLKKFLLEHNLIEIDHEPDLVGGLRIA